MLGGVFVECGSLVLSRGGFWGIVQLILEAQILNARKKIYGRK